MRTYPIITGIIKYNEKYLLSKRTSDAKVSPNEWEFVSGSFDTRESGEEIVIRECKEETGLECEIIVSGESITFLDKDTKWIVIPYLLESKSEEVVLSYEHSEYRWCTLEDVKVLSLENGDLYLDRLINRVL